MKALRIISHPAILISSFMLILISGESFGGFYLLYLLMALPHGGVHSLVALAGVLLLVASLLKFNRQNRYWVEGILNIGGLALLVCSLVLFFVRDRKGYNNSTFEETVPQITLFLFGIFAIAFITFNIINSSTKKSKSGNLSVSH